MRVRMVRCWRMVDQRHSHHVVGKYLMVVHRVDQSKIKHTSAAASWVEEGECGVSARPVRV